MQINKLRGRVKKTINFSIYKRVSDNLSVRIKYIFWKFIIMNNTEPQGASLKGYYIFHTLFLLLILTSGCGNKFFDPTQVGRFSKTPTVNLILNTLGVAEETPLAWEQGEPPRPIDTVAVKTDLTFMAGDIIGVYIYELLSQGVPYEQNFVVSETGKISVPDVGDLQVTGKTETQVEDMIKEVLTPNILVNPIVSVTLLQSQQRSFSILGDGVRFPNRYPLPPYNDFRLQAALALAGSVSQVNVSFLYVTRQVTQGSSDGGTSKNDRNDFRSIRSPYNLREPVTASSLERKKNTSDFPANKVVVASSEMVSDRGAYRYPGNYNQYRNNIPRGFSGRNMYQFSEMQGEVKNRVSVEEALKRVTGQPTETKEVPGKEEGQPQPGAQKPPARTGAEEEQHIEWIFQNGAWVPVVVETPGATGAPPTPGVTPTPQGQIDWELRDGQWVPVQKGVPEAKVPPTTIGKETKTIEKEYPWLQQVPEARLIKIPIDKAIAGDPDYNIVIKPGDTIVVPLDVAGVYFIMGNVNRAGPVEMSGGKVTLKQAIATAGNLGPLAWPQRCEITRQLGLNREETVSVDLEKIFNGEQPNIYIKPGDVINIGTHSTSRWRAILRNAFRATYGFGFVYDRNFADRDFYTSRPFDIF
jgi:protein involved in polysaccharide export with SLBB domain